MKKLELQVNSEFGKLKRAIVHNANTLVSPENVEKIPYDISYYEKEKHFHPEDGLWDVGLFQEQLKAFHDLLEENGVELIHSKDVEHAWLQSYTRDIGFVIGNTFYFSKMRNEARELEQKGIEHLKERLPRYKIIKNGIIEGGDVFVYEDIVFVGISRQTNMTAFNELKDLVSKEGYECIPIPCKKSVLHLDCRYNITSKEKSVLYGNDVLPEGVKNLKENFKGEILRGPDKELKTIGPNFSMISPNLAVVDERNKWTSDTLNQNGYNIKQLNFSEVIKLWGSLRCVTLPLYRE